VYLLPQLVGQSAGFSSGAPMSVCDGDMKPRHGFDPQVSIQCFNWIVSHCHFKSIITYVLDNNLLNRCFLSQLIRSSKRIKEEERTSRPFNSSFKM
jgi:hypothetical protein